MFKKDFVVACEEQHTERGWTRFSVKVLLLSWVLTLTGLMKPVRVITKPSKK